MLLTSGSSRTGKACLLCKTVGDPPTAVSEALSHEAMAHVFIAEVLLQGTDNCGAVVLGSEGINIDYKWGDWPLFENLVRAAARFGIQSLCAWYSSGESGGTPRFMNSEVVDLAGAGWPKMTASGSSRGPIVITSAEGSLHDDEVRALSRMGFEESRGGCGRFEFPIVNVESIVICPYPLVYPRLLLLAGPEEMLWQIVNEGISAFGPGVRRVEVRWEDITSEELRVNRILCWQDRPT